MKNTNYGPPILMNYALGCPHIAPLTGFLGKEWTGCRCYDGIWLV